LIGSKILQVILFNLDKKGKREKEEEGKKKSACLYMTNVNLTFIAGKYVVSPNTTQIQKQRGKNKRGVGGGKRESHLIVAKYDKPDDLIFFFSGKERGGRGKTKETNLKQKDSLLTV